MDSTDEFIKVIGNLLDVSTRKNIIIEDHGYALEDKTFIQGNYLSIPTQFLFLDSFTKIRKPNNTDSDVDIIMEDDIKLPLNSQNDLIDKFNKAIHEGLIVNRDGDYENDWQSNVIKFTWTSRQIQIYDRTVGILMNYQHSKMICNNGSFQSIKEKVYLEKSMQQFRRLLIHFDWEIELIRWLHFNLVSLLPISLLAAYTEILYLLKTKIPWVVLEMTESAFIPSSNLSATHTQGMNNGIMTKQIKDNFVTIANLIHSIVTGTNLSLDVQVPLKSNLYSRSLRAHSNKYKTIVLVVPPLPFDTSNPGSGFNHLMLGTRFTSWLNDFMIAQRGWTVDVLSVEGLVPDRNTGPAGLALRASDAEKGDGLEPQISPLNFVRTVFAALRTKILKLKSQNPTSTVIVWGWNIGSLMACYASLQTTADAIVCLGFPFVDLKEKRILNASAELSQLENNLVLLQRVTSPIVYVIGAITRINSIKFVEQLRYRQKSAPSALIVVGHTNDELCLLDDRIWVTDSDDVTKEVHVTQEIADALVFEAICQGLDQLLTLRNVENLTTAPVTTLTALSATSALNNAGKATKRLQPTSKAPSRGSTKAKPPKVNKHLKVVSDQLRQTPSPFDQPQSSSTFPIMSSQVSPGKPLLKKLFTG